MGRGVHHARKAAATSGADLLRLGNDLGFVMVAVGGMFAASLSIGCLSVQARAAGVFGKRLLIFSLAVAVVLLGSLAFVPILALLIWVVVVAVVMKRGGALTPSTGA